MTGALERIEHATAALRRELQRGVAPRWLLLSRFGTEFLEPAGAGAAARAAIEIGLLGGGRLLATRFELGGIPTLSIELEDLPEAEALVSVHEALPVFVAGQLGMSGVVLLLAACGLASVPRAPALAAVRDWIRVGGEDPLRGIDPTRLGPRFPELRGLARERELAIVADLLAQRHELPPAVAVARRGPSGATDAEMEAWSRIGGDLLVEGGGAEVVAARHQGLAGVTIALVLDRAGAHGVADPGELAQAAETLLPRLSLLLPDLLRRLERDDAKTEAAS